MQSPAGQEDIRRPTAVGGSRACLARAKLNRTGRQKAWVLNLRRQAGGSGTLGEESTEPVVALATVAAAKASSRMIAEAVCNPIAESAIAIGRCNGEAEAHVEKHTEKGRLKRQAKGISRTCMQPRPSSRLLQDLQVGLRCLTLNRANQRPELLGIQRGRQCLLLGWRRAGGQGIGGGNGRVVLGQGTRHSSGAYCGDSAACKWWRKRKPHMLPRHGMQRYASQGPLQLFGARPGAMPFR